MLDVECVSTVRHAVASISPTLQPEPQVTVVLDRRKFVVQADEILTDNEFFASLPNGVKKLRIAITAKGFTVSADGKSIPAR